MSKRELENFERTLTRLHQFLADAVITDRDRAGVIQAFEFTFEQCWRSLQKLASRSGGQVGNAKQGFTFAIQSGWIERSQEMDWIRLIEDRNLTSHTYNVDLAVQVLTRIEERYLRMFDGLIERLRKEAL